MISTCTAHNLSDYKESSFVLFGCSSVDMETATELSKTITMLLRIVLSADNLIGSCILPEGRTLNIPDLCPHSIMKISDELQRMDKNKGTKG